MSLRLPLPELIGGYRVLRRLPSPGGVDLYLGREEGPLGFRREVELKLVANPRDDPQHADELAREAAAAAELRHPALVQMFQFFEHEGRLVLVLEHVQGTNLARLLSVLRRRRQTLPQEVAFHIAHRLAGALAHAHGKVDERGKNTPVIHRAVCPSAILLGWDGAVRLSGFGLAKITGRSPDTVIGLIKGKPGYMAPEQLRGDPVTERVDVYQTGLVFWEMLTGQLPAGRGEQRLQTLDQIFRMGGDQRLPSIATVCPSLPKEIAAVIDAALEPVVEKRTIRCAEIERWLARTVNVENGRDLLRNQVSALRSAALRNVAAISTESTRGPGSLRGRRPAPRFPGFSIRLTGRPSLAGTEALPAARRVPPVPARASVTSIPVISVSPPAISPTGKNRERTPAPPVPPSIVSRAPVAARSVQAPLPAATSLQASPQAHHALGQTPERAPPALMFPSSQRQEGHVQDVPAMHTHAMQVAVLKPERPVITEPGGNAHRLQVPSPSDHETVRVPSAVSPASLPLNEAKRVVSEAHFSAMHYPPLSTEHAVPSGSLVGSSDLSDSSANTRPWWHYALGCALTIGFVSGAALSVLGVLRWIHEEHTSDSSAAASNRGIPQLNASAPHATPRDTTGHDTIAHTEPLANSAHQESPPALNAIPPKHGLVTVHPDSDLEGYIYVNGVPYGRLGRSVVVPCGRWFLRIGAPPEVGKATRWVSKGVPIIVRCGQALEVHVQAER